jgi:hypothetical protein
MSLKIAVSVVRFRPWHHGPLRRLPLLSANVLEVSGNNQLLVRCYPPSSADNQNICWYESWYWRERRLVDLSDRIEPLPITDTVCRNRKAGLKPYKLSDGGGLYLLVEKNGSKLWRHHPAPPQINARMESRQLTPINGGLNQQYRRKAVVRTMSGYGVSPAVPQRLSLSPKSAPEPVSD